MPGVNAPAHSPRCSRASRRGTAPSTRSTCRGMRRTSRPETRWRRLQSALRRHPWAQDHASGCPRLRPASDNQPLGPRWPATQAFLST
eukprot:scaffold25509_cov75-Phaeocystis_antarctica.AAC.1